MNKRQIIFIVLTILWMALIFSMSNANGEESGSLSRKVTKIMCSVIVPGFDKLPIDEQEMIIEKHHFFVRKMAHGTEYAILGMLLCGVCFEGNLTIKKMLIPLIIGILYAVTDEIHQLFVSERAGQIADVIIDSGGVFAGIMICSGLYLLTAKLKFNNLKQR